MYTHSCTLFHREQLRLTTNCCCRTLAASIDWTTLVRSRESTQFVLNTPSCCDFTEPSWIMKYLNIITTTIWQLNNSQLNEYYYYLLSMHKAAIKQIRNIQTYKIQNIIRWQTVQTQTKQRTFTWSVEISSAQIPYLLQTAICSLIDRLVAKRCTSTCELACNLRQKSIRLWSIMCDIDIDLQ